MGAMPMGDGVPPLASFQQHYWAVVGTAIAIGTFVNIASYIMYRQRYVGPLTTGSRPR